MTIMDTWLRRWASRNAPQSPTSVLDNKGYISIPKDGAKGITSESDESDGKREDDTKMKNPCSDCEYKDYEYCRCLERYKYDQQKKQPSEPLKELIDLIDSQPKPCKFHLDTKGWFAKINEETFEAHEQAVLGNKDAEAEELTDIITVCVSMLEDMGYDQAARMKIQRDVNEKNRKRNYLK